PANGRREVLRQVNDIQHRLSEPGCKLRDRHNGVDTAVADHVGDLTIAQQKVNRDNNLAGKETSVKAGDESRAGRQKETDSRLAGLRAKIRPKLARHRGELLIRITAAIVDDRDFLRLALCAGEERLKKHVLAFA